MTSESIKLFKPMFNDIPAILDSIKECLESGWVINGKKTQELEKMISDYLGVKHVVMTNSGTAALQLAIRNKFILRGGYILSTPNTFIATNSTIKQNTDANIIFADIEEYGNVNVDQVISILKELVKKKERVTGIMIVHYSGIPVRMAELNDIASYYNIPIIEDCAHCFGATYDGITKVGNSNNTCAFSLHAVKPFAVGEGGFVTTNNKFLADKMRKQSWFGIDKSTFCRSTCESDKSYSWEYEIEELGYKLHYNDILSSIAIEQLKVIDSEIERRRSIATLYYNELKDVEGIQVFDPNSIETLSKYASFYFYPIFTAGKIKNKDLMNELNTAGIETGMHYIQNCEYLNLNWTENKSYGIENQSIYGTKISHTFSSREVTIPFGTHLSNDDVNYIILAIKQSLQKLI